MLTNVVRNAGTVRSFVAMGKTFYQDSQESDLYEAEMTYLDYYVARELADEMGELDTPYTFDVDCVTYTTRSGGVAQYYKILAVNMGGMK